MMFPQRGLSLGAHSFLALSQYYHSHQTFQQIKKTNYSLVTIKENIAAVNANVVPFLWDVRL